MSAYLWRQPPTFPPYQPQPLRRPIPATAAAGSSYTLTDASPASGPLGSPSNNFTVTPAGTITSVITPHDGGQGGTFTPSTLTFSSSSAPQTFTYTPAVVGAITVSTTNSTGLTDPGSVVYTSTRVTAANYYVRLDGNDSNTGTNDTSGGAWLTVTKANSGPTGGYIAGDTLTFDGTAGVTFTGNFVWGTSGTATSRCVISGTNNALISCGNGDGVKVLDAEFTTVQNLIVTGSGVSSSTGATTSTGYGIRFHDDRQAGSKWRSVYVTGCTVSGCLNGIGITTLLPSDSPSAVIGFADIRVTGNTIHDCQASGIETIGGVTWLQAPPASVPATTGVFKGIYVAGNVIYNIFGYTSTLSQSIWLLNCSGGMIERNVVHDCGKFTTGPGVNDNAQIMTSSSDNIVIQWNEVYHGFLGCAIDPDLASTYILCQYNYTHENDGAGLMDFSNTPTATNVFRYNVSRNDGLQSAESGILRLQNNTIVYGNTIISDKNLITGSTKLIEVGGNPLLYNNIFVGNNGLQLVHISAGTPTFIGNLYYTGSGSTAIFDGSITTLAGWRSAGYEKTSNLNFGVIGDPLLSNPTAGAGVGTLPAAQVGTLTYFDLTGSSPARGAGVTPELVDTIFGPVDYHDYPWRTGAAVDVGAVAYGASSLVPGFGGGGGGSGGTNLLADGALVS